MSTAEAEGQVHPSNPFLSEPHSMSNLHYFQRYSQEENLVTNNTLRLFSELYRESPNRLRDLLEQLVDGVSVEVGVSMQQQTKGPSSVPDGALIQSSFKVVLETKKRDSFSTGQLERHLEAFDGEEQRILLLLTPREPNVGKIREAEQRLKEYDEGIAFATVQFEDLIDLLVGEEEGLISEYEQDLRAVVEDYQNFCSAEGLLPDDDLMRAVPCGTSHEDNFRFDLYYHPASRGYRRHQYIGIYFDKSIRGIGRLKKTVEMERVDGNLEGKEVKELSEDEKQRIHGAMDEAPRHGYSIERDHEFFLVDRFYSTDFTKDSKYGMPGPQYFSLRDHLEIEETETLPSTDLIADKLSEATWE